MIVEFSDFVSNLRKIPPPDSAMSSRALESSLDRTSSPFSSRMNVCLLPRIVCSGMTDPCSDPTPIAMMSVPSSLAFAASSIAFPSRFSPSVKRISAWLSASLSFSVELARLIASARLVPPLATA